MANNGDNQARGPVSPAVYRRRRLVVAIAVLIILALLMAGGIAIARMFGANSSAQNNDGDTSANTQPTEGAGQESAGAQTPSADPNTCQPDLIEVSASTDAASYAPEVVPVFTLSITNNNTVDCTINVGTTQQEFQVVSGEDRIFSSVDCQMDPVDLEKTIAPGASETANFDWERNRTSPGCEPVQAVPLPGTYNLTVKLGDNQSDPVVFQLL